MEGQRGKIIDLNSDMGEGFDEAEKELLALVTSANIACGGHAGNEQTMTKTVAGALAKGVRIGAHTSYPDRENFGRVSMKMGGPELMAAISDQVSELRRVVEAQGGKVAYMKPHGALFHDAARDEAVAKAVLDVARAEKLPVMALAGSSLASEPNGISEGFIDRAYRDGMLVPRGEQGALITDPELAAAAALALAPKVDSLCVHSDTPGSPQLMLAARKALQDAGYSVKSS